MREDEAFRAEITAAAAKFWPIVSAHFGLFSQDEQTAFRLAQQYIEWALRPPEAVTVVYKKPAIHFADIRLGDKPEGGA